MSGGYASSARTGPIYPSRLYRQPQPQMSNITTGQGNISSRTRNILSNTNRSSLPTHKDDYKSTYDRAYQPRTTTTSYRSPAGVSSTNYSRNSYGGSTPKYDHISSSGYGGSTASDRRTYLGSGGSRTSSVDHQFEQMGLSGGTTTSTTRRASGVSSHSNTGDVAANARLSRPRKHMNIIGESPPASGSTHTRPSHSHSLDHLGKGGQDENNNNHFPEISGSQSSSRVGSREEDGCVGLQNIGNTCFMNSILQCLSNSKPLLEYMLNGDYRSDVNRNSDMKGELVKSYSQLMEALWRRNSARESIRDPIRSFKSAVQRFAPRFTGYNQQDAQEFLRYVLEGLHEDVNKIQTRPKGQTYDEKREERMSTEEKSEEYWRRYLSFDKSHIVDIFVGQLRSTLTCQVCDYKSVTFDPFWDLSLQIPEGRTAVSIEDCLAAFTKKEYLDGDEMPKCARCKDRRRCSKELSIQKFPQILVLHLKRFSGERYRSKLSKRVGFPSKLRDLSEFVAGRERSPTYSLYGVCCHSGSVYSGHYVAYCRHPYKSRWHLFNDSRVSPVSAESIDSSEAYVLFYQKEQ